MELYGEKIKALINAALVDGEITDKERSVLMKRAKEEGIDPDEFEMVLDARLHEKNVDKHSFMTSLTAPVPVDKESGLLGGRFTSSIISMFKSTESKESSEKDSDENLSIPNTKKELLEFMSSLKPKIRKSEYYVDIYEECVNKAKRLFPNDPTFNSYILGFEDTAIDIRKELKEKKEEKRQNDEDKKILLVLLFLLANGLLVFLLLGVL